MEKTTAGQPRKMTMESMAEELHLALPPLTEGIMKDAHVSQAVFGYTLADNRLKDKLLGCLEIEELSTVSKANSDRATFLKMIENDLQLIKSGASEKYPSFTFECEIVVRQAQAIVNLVKVKNYLRLLELNKVKGKLIANHDNPWRNKGYLYKGHKDAHSALISLFDAYYSPWVEQVRLAEDVAKEVKTQVMKAVLDFTPNTTHLDYKQSLIGNQALFFGPRATGGAKQVHDLLQMEIIEQSAPNNLSFSPFDIMLENVLADVRLRFLWTAFKSLRTWMEKEKDDGKHKYSNLKEHFKFHDDESMTVIIHKSGRESSASGT